MWALVYRLALPGGVIGNTWAFGAHIPGSSPGRVGFDYFNKVYWNVAARTSELVGVSQERMDAFLRRGEE